MNLIYLDNNATTKPAPEVVHAMTLCLEEGYGNPSSVHRLGQQARAAIDTAREQVAGLLGCGSRELTFTGGGTEATNTVIRGLAIARSPRRRIITSTVEHSATRELCTQLADEGFEIVQIPVDEGGLLKLDLLQVAMDDSVALVSLIWANNETGVLFPIERIATLCRQKKIPLHIDGTQAAGKIPVDLHKLGPDAFTFAGHKFHGPKGVGGFYLRRGVRLRGLILGGPQESGRRGGTENVPGIVGMGVAAQIAQRDLGEMKRVATLRDRLEAGILQSVPDSRVNGNTLCRIPNTTNIAFPRLEAEAILLLLSEKGVCASAGAACSSGSLEPSHVLQAMGIDPIIGHGAIRLSLSRYTTPSEIDQALNIIPPVIEKIRTILPMGIGGACPL